MPLFLDWYCLISLLTSWTVEQRILSVGCVWFQMRRSRVVDTLELQGCCLKRTKQPGKMALWFSEMANVRSWIQKITMLICTGWTVTTWVTTAEKDLWDLLDSKLNISQKDAFSEESVEDPHQIKIKIKICSIETVFLFCFVFFLTSYLCMAPNRRI